MIHRSDVPRLGASLGLLGTVLEMNGQTAWDRTFGWQYGPRQPPQSGVRGGGVGEAGAEDRKAEEKQRARAAEHFVEFRGELDALDRLVQMVMRRIDVAVPPNVSDMKNRRTGDLDPMTAADVAVAGWCRSCWRNDQQLVPIETNKKTSLRYFRDYCRWCGAFRAKHGIEPPVNLLVLRHDGRRITEADVAEAVKSMKAEARKSKKKGKKGKAA